MGNFEKRVYGAIIVKSKLANYNADFTGNPRTLPDGTVYATDKVIKFKIRDYLNKEYSNEKIFVKTKYKNDINPMTLEEVYKYHFSNIPPKNDKLRNIKILSNLLSCLDVRLFGATFAMKGNENVNLSIHGPVQISYGVNRLLEWKDSGMFTDQIGSQFASEEGASQTTLGSQTRSFEAHYVHHFSINPKNLSKFVEQISKDNNSKFQLLKDNDIKKLKEAMLFAVTSYDSTSKKDAENEFLMWVEMDNDTILRNFTDLIEITKEKENGKTKINLGKVFEYLDEYKNDISKIEIYYDEDFTELSGIPEDKWKENEKEKILTFHKLSCFNNSENQSEDSKTGLSGDDMG